MRQAETNRQICALQIQLEKYWEESGYKDEEKRYDLDRSSTGNFTDQFGSDQDDTKMCIRDSRYYYRQYSKIYTLCRGLNSVLLYESERR